MHFSIMQCSLNQTPAVFFFVSPLIPQASATFGPSFLFFGSSVRTLGVHLLVLMLRTRLVWDSEEQSHLCSALYVYRLVLRIIKSATVTPEQPVRKHKLLKKKRNKKTTYKLQCLPGFWASSSLDVGETVNLFLRWLKPPLTGAAVRKNNIIQPVLKPLSCATDYLEGGLIYWISVNRRSCLCSVSADKRRRWEKLKTGCLWADCSSYFFDHFDDVCSYWSVIRLLCHGRTKLKH